MPSSVKDLMSKNPVAQVLVYGPPGSGKTSWAAMSPTPFYILTEMQGAGSVYVQDENIIVEPVLTFKHFAMLMRALKRGVPCQMDNGQPAFKFRYPLEPDVKYSQEVLKYCEPDTYVIQTLVVDSITKLHKIIADAHPHSKNPGEIDFFKVQRIMDQVLDDMRSLPVNLVCIALEDRVFAKAKKGTERRLIGIQPALFGKMASRAGQYFSGVGYSNCQEYTDEGGNIGVRYALSWQMPQSVQSKTPPCVGRMFPSHTFSDFTNPGRTSLGSMLKAMYPNQPTACNDHDSADFVWNQ